MGTADRPLGVSKSKPKRHDTLESTWKKITDGRAVPLTRHLKKSDTWVNRLCRNNENTPPPPRVKKSENFNDGCSDGAAAAKCTTTPSRKASGKLRREASSGQDELNRRVEAFIRKFNEEMRLQRQASLNQYQEMIQLGAA
ncbi:hypothetical protein SAY87_004127 [Trapa incisa]|uniref:Uncharacterized protein n=1 Tax=Trapa incisa TaxID=236973 RepID=A0AAN7JNE1_9MYRT|nr:hypothetical protein SAY87_004127 [Trapa incisa]